MLRTGSVFLFATILVMRISERFFFVGLLALLAVVVTGLVMTRDIALPDATQAQSDGKKSETTGESLIDQRPLQTARQLAALAATPEEKRFAQDSLRLADHLVDLAFASALRDANEQERNTPETPEIKAAQDRIREIQTKARNDRDRLQQLSTKAEHASSEDAENLQKEKEIAEAELALDEDELADAQEDLVRAGGDTQARLQQLRDEHEASQHAAPNPLEQRNDNASENGRANLLAQWREWSRLQSEQNQLRRASDLALSSAAELSTSHQALEKHIAEEQGEQKDLSQQAAGLLNQRTGESAIRSKAVAAAALSSVRRLSSDQRTLSELDKRVQSQQELASTYGQWGTLLKGRQRLVLNALLRSVMWIVLIGLLVFAVDRSLERFFGRLTVERKRLLSLRVLARFSVQAVGVLLVLLVIFGTPTQMGTIVGLATAGLTVALKDFIVSFVGWFVLMGRNGIRVGDWVEIHGVSGEVLEIGLIRTVLLETGKAGDAGHPTGRQVAFVNSFAVEGHYFNFSTSGQWLWDELQILIPSGEDPYPTIENIHKIVTEDTEANARMAEQEWQRVARRHGVKSFSASPTLSMRPTSGGVEIVVRYITRAQERYEARNRLYQEMVQMLHGKRAGNGADATSSIAAGAR
jgi:small-conductance mechanosensitive channel